MSRCLSRVLSETDKLPFSDGKHYFYLELQCDRISDEEVCGRCSLKSKNIDHGLVGGSYNEKSHIFASPWYFKSLKAYGTPTKEVLEKAMEAQVKARGKGSVKVVRKVASVDTCIKILPLDKMVESSDDPIEVDSVVHLTLKSLMIDDMKYWLDYETRKVYKRASNGRLDYVGLWDGKAICDIADSDD